MHYFTHLETVPRGVRIAADRPQNADGKGLLKVRNDLDRIRQEVSIDDISRGPPSLWRYAPLLPIVDPTHAITLGEGLTPLLPVERLAHSLGCAALWVKDEGQNPSGTFKDRGAAVALTRYR